MSLKSKVVVRDSSGFLATIKEGYRIGPRHITIFFKDSRQKV